MNNFADKNNPLMPDHIGHSEYDVEGNKELQRDTLRSIPNARTCSEIASDMRLLETAEAADYYNWLRQDPYDPRS